MELGTAFKCRWCGAKAVRVRRAQRYCGRRCSRAASAAFIRARNRHRERERARDLEGARRLGRA